MQELRPGQILDQRYRLIRVLSAGSFGVVWAAEHLALRSLVAVKVLEQGLVAGEDMRQRFSREARAAAALRSPHVVQILDCGMAGDAPYIAMELLEGESLEQRLERVRVLDGIETERVLRHVSRAIERASEAGVVHRDLKPGNIFIQANGGDEIVKVIDFGIAKTSVNFDRSLVGATPTGTLIGTPHYMSPEYIRGDQALDVRADLWALAVIAYECLTGALPFQGDNISAVLSAICSDARPIPSEHGTVPAGFDAWFQRACAAHPDNRFGSAKQMAEEFAVLNRGGVVSRAAAAPVAPLRRVRPHLRRWGAGLVLLAAAASLWRLDAARPDVSGTALAPGAAMQREARASLRRSPPPVQIEAATGEPAVAEATSELRQPLSVPSFTEVERSRNTSPRAREPIRTSRTSRSSGEPESDGSRSPPRRSKPSVRNPSPLAQRVVGECDPPWDIDFRGKPRAKPECL